MKTKASLLIHLFCALGLSGLAQAQDFKKYFSFDFDSNTPIDGPDCNSENTWILEEVDGYSILFGSMFLDLPGGRDKKKCTLNLRLKVNSRDEIALQQTLTYGIIKSQGSSGNIRITGKVRGADAGALRVYFPEEFMDRPLEQKQFFLPHSKGRRGRSNLCMDRYDFDPDDGLRELTIKLEIDGDINRHDEDYMFLATDGLDARYRIQVYSCRGGKPHKPIFAQPAPPPAPKAKKVSFTPEYSGQCRTSDCRAWAGCVNQKYRDSGRGPAIHTLKDTHRFNGNTQCKFSLHGSSHIDHWGPVIN